MTAGLIGLFFGAQLIVYAAVEFATLAGVSELMIGLAIVTLGTSLPELATSIVAPRRGDADIVFGNVTGSNILNLLLILAIVAVIASLPVQSTSSRIDLPAMIAFFALLVPIMLRGMVISRWEGALLLSGYVTFLGWQIYAALAGHGVG